MLAGTKSANSKATVFWRPLLLIIFYGYIQVISQKPLIILSRFLQVCPVHAANLRSVNQRMCVSEQDTIANCDLKERKKGQFLMIIQRIEAQQKCIAFAGIVTNLNRQQILCHVPVECLLSHCSDCILSWRSRRCQGLGMRCRLTRLRVLTVRTQML